MVKKSTILKYAVMVICVIAGVFHLVCGVTAVSTMTLRTWHWMIIAILVFLVYPAKKGTEKLRWFDWIFLIMAVVSAAYEILVWPSRGQLLASNDPLFQTLDIVIGWMMIVTILEAARRTAGIAMTIIAGIALIYLFWLGPYMPGILLHKGYSFARVMPYMMFTTEGIFGISLGTCASFIVLFVLFGAFLEVTGGGQFFIDAAFSIAGRFRGGPAKTAVISSMLMGCISGSPIANVVTTGTFTIPLMRKAGYDKDTACSIEAVASTGGMIMPPMMGAAAFIMAEYLSMSYGEICIAALIPAVMYYVVLFVIVDKEAAKRQILGLPASELPKLGETVRQSGHLLIPLFVLIICLFMNYSPQKTVFWAIMILLLVSLLKKETRITLAKLVEGFRAGICQVIPVATACAAAGIVVAVISMTGLGVRFTSSIVTISGGNPFIALIFTAIAALILGMGLPAAAVYIVVSVVAAPALTNMGFTALASHMFVFYFGIISTITPPVALTAYAAAGMVEDGNAVKVGFKAFSYALVAFILPFVWMYEPSFLLDAPIMQIIPNVVIAFFGLFYMASGTTGFLFHQTNVLGRLYCYLLAILMFWPILTVNYIGLVIGILTILIRKTPIMNVFEPKKEIAYDK